MPDSQQIDIPGVGIVEFPSSMSDADVSAAAKRLHDEANYRPDPTMQGRTAQAMYERQGGFPRAPSAPQSDAPVSDQPSVMRGVLQMGEPFAHPSSVGDVAGLMLPGTEGIGQKALSALTKPALRLLGGAAGAGAGVATAPNGSLTNKFIRGAIGAGIGLGAPDAVAAVSHIPGASKLVEPLVSGVERMRSWNNPLTAAGREAAATERSLATVDHFAPNTGGAPFDTSLKWEQDLPQAPSQAVYVQLSDGSYGLKAAPGHTLTEGARVNAMNRAGTGQMHTVGPVNAEGIAPLGSHPPPVAPVTPAQAMLFRGKPLDPAIQERVMELLRQQAR